MKNDFPKILLVNCILNKQNGTGITLYNLLKGWPKDKIFIAADRIYDEGIEVCENYYRLGNKESKRPWPFNKLQPYYRSGAITLKPQAIGSNNYMMVRSRYNKKIKSLFVYVLHLLGIYNYIFKNKVSGEFIDWIKEVDPDVLYTAYGSSDSILFFEDILKKVNKPYAIHIMDDWISTMNSVGLERVVSRQKVLKSFKRQVANASSLIAIGEAMKEEYEDRYGREFISFQNCIEPDFWFEQRKSDVTINNEFQILYAGRIGIGTSNSVLMFAKAVELLGEAGFNVEFQIQTKFIPEKINEKLKQLKYTVIVEFIDYNLLPKKLSSVDLLVLPMDFDKKNLKYIRLSMPTKVPEYLACGTPIIVLASEVTALAKYAIQSKWAKVVSDNSQFKIKEALVELIVNKGLRQSIVSNGRKVLIENHIAETIRDDFREVFVKSYRVDKL